MPDTLGVWVTKASMLLHGPNGALIVSGCVVKDKRVFKKRSFLQILSMVSGYLVHICLYTVAHPFCR